MGHIPIIILFNVHHHYSGMPLSETESIPWTELTPAEPVCKYCTPEDVADAMGLPDPNNPMGQFMFSDMSVPKYETVCRLIVSAEDEIDRRTRRSWRENRVVEHVSDINSYWHDVNGWRSDYYAQGGYYVQLRKDIRPWDPTPIEEGGKGDKLEIRSRDGSWTDVSDVVDRPDNEGFCRAWFDRQYGKLYLRNSYMFRRFNACRITYRYGSEEPVPAAIRRLCSIMVASQVINMSVFYLKVGMGGDISGIRDQLLANWAEEEGRIFSSFQRAGKVHSMLR